ncbi:MAG: DUF3106 domain-containing protein [Phycisphaerae bacterium]
MRKLTGTILLIVFVGLGLASRLCAQGDSDALRRPPAGSIAAQLRLKQKLLAEQQGTTLAATLRHNRRQWESLSPEQRDHYRRVAVAFLRENPDKQRELIEHYDEFIKMSAERRQAYRQRERWLKVVVASFTPRERDELRNMPADERARRLITRRDKLVEQGKLKLEEPTTQPSE